MPALIMAFEKIISTPLKRFIQFVISDQQYAVKDRSDINLAKIDMAFAANKGYNKMLLIDIKKAYDSVNLKFLKSKISEVYLNQKQEDKQNMEIVATFFILPLY